MSSELHPLLYRGVLVAIVGPRRCHVIARGLSADDMRFTLTMCLCAREVFGGRVPGPFTSEVAERWARLLLVAEYREELEGDATDAEVAGRIGMPVDQVVLARDELAAATGRISGAGR